MLRVVFPFVLLPGLFMEPALAQGVEPFDQSQVRTFELTFGGPGWHFVLRPGIEGCTEEGLSTLPGLLVCSGEDAGAFAVNAGYRGNGTCQFAPSFANTVCYEARRYPWKISMITDSWGDLDQLRLNAPLTDQSYMREILGRRVLGACSLVPRGSLVRVEPGPSYGVADHLPMGMWVLQEHIDARFEARNFLGSEGNRFRINTEPGNYFLAWDGVAQVHDLFVPLGSTGSEPCAEVEGLYNSTSWVEGELGPDSDTDCDWEELYGIGWVLEHIDPNHEQFPIELERHLDVDRYLWAIAAWNILGDLDHMQCRYLEDSHHGRMVLIPYDIGHSLPTLPWYGFQYYNPFLGSNDFHHGDELLTAILSNPKYQARFSHHARYAFSQAPNPVEFECLGELFRESVVQNAGGDGTLECPGGGYTYPPLEPSDGYAEVVNNAFFDDPVFCWPVTRDRYAERYQALGVVPEATALEPNIYAVTRTPELAQADSEVVVRALVLGLAPEVALRWRVQGSYQRMLMLDDGVAPDLVAGDFEFAAAIPGQAEGQLVEYYVEVIHDVGGLVMSFEPDRAGAEPLSFHVANGWELSPVVINEFLADGGTSDFVELYNPSELTIDLSGWVLDDDPFPGPDEDDDRYVFEDSVDIGPGEHLLVWCGDGIEPGLRAPFGLSKKGEMIVLARPDSEENPVVLVQRYLRQNFRVSRGRAVDGRDFWATFVNPTPGFSNGFLGDVNEDGLVNFQDLVALSSSLGMCGFDLSADLNKDFVVDEQDLEALQALL